MKQVILIHGGDPQKDYESYLEWLKNYPIKLERHAMRPLDWQDLLAQTLGPEYQVIRPQMPSKRNAKYIEWKIWFEKFFQFVKDDVILVGSSLGGTFLAKYLAENDFPRRIKALILVAGAYGGSTQHENLWDFSMPASLSKTAKQAEKIILYHSKDDLVVPFEQVDNFKKAWPKAELRIFDDRGHFNQTELPELIEDIKSL